MANKKINTFLFLFVVAFISNVQANDSINFDFNSIFSNASTEEGKKNIVPTYSGTDIPESKLNANDLNNAKFGNFSNNESANFINQSYTNRQKYDTTQLGNIVDNTKYIQNNSQSIVNHNYCDPYNDTEYKICYKYYGINDCHNNHITKNCLTNFQFQCMSYESGCTTSGIELSSLPSDLDWSYDGNTGILIIGKKTGANYWSGTCLVVDKTIEFNISNLDLVEMFTLNRAIFDDYMSITLNDNLVYVGPHGGTKLEVISRKVGLGGLKQKVVDYGTGQSSCELSTIWNQYINKDLTGFLKKGKNVLKMRVIVSGTGQGSMEFVLKNKCCKEYLEKWTSSCDSNLMNCSLTSKICTKKDANIVFDGKSIFKKCAEYNETYDCISDNNCYNNDNDCDRFDISKCNLEKSEFIGNETEKFTYKCITPRTTPKDCQQNIQCLDGSCYELEPTQDNTQNMIEAVSELSTINESVKTIDADSLTMLNGDNLKCKKSTSSAAAFKDCCGDANWGNTLSGCNPNEEKLKEKRGNGDCIYVGSYCSEYLDVGLTKVCITKKYSYCCFGNKFSKIMANASREQGLQTWGDGEYTNCNGIAITDLNKLDFSRIDFSELYKDIKDSVEKEKIDRQIQEALQRVKNE